MVPIISDLLRIFFFVIKLKPYKTKNKIFTNKDQQDVNTFIVYQTFKIKVTSEILR